ncbi:hypothetical protein [Micromonospora sp. NPDC051296]|uniref:hypothetical protein n=1 Tax=Micromonospora sp. NPDC051296 TaxID=3155046 RepID=UPI0034337081
MTATVRHPALHRLADQHGNLTMLALDQRESLRTMLQDGDLGREVPDSELVEFKALATETLSPYASAILLDREFALAGGRPATIAPDTALILAADDLHQNPGETVHGSSVDPTVTVEYIRSVDAAALKFLVIWQPDEGADQRAAIVGEFLELCRRSGTISLLEGIVRPPRGRGWTDPAERHEAILAAARELSAFGPDVYKAEVPGYVPGDVSAVQEQAAAMSEIVGGAWVVLSNGVRGEDFAAAVERSVAGGAAGFLAGRAIWADTIGEADVSAALRTRSVERLTRLQRLVAESVA